MATIRELMKKEGKISVTLTMSPIAILAAWDNLPPTVVTKITEANPSIVPVIDALRDVVGALITLRSAYSLAKKTLATVKTVKAKVDSSFVAAEATIKGNPAPAAQQLAVEAADAPSKLAKSAQVAGAETLRLAKNGVVQLFLDTEIPNT